MMGTKLNKVPKNEAELKGLLQSIYEVSKSNYENDKENNFTGILEVIASEPNILSAIHKIKQNKGSKTPGVDGKIIRDYLDKGYDEVIADVRQMMMDYHPMAVRRVWIPKPGKSAKRPLGIPAIVDRIVQECVRNVIEPIAEAQFFEHSYGFRPMRSADMAIARITKLNFIAKCNWVVEGDIKGFFDNIDHNVMIESLWNIGIRDRRVLCIIKEMLKAGVMGEAEVSDIGTPQGGIISPLLANIYLNRFDQYIANGFEHKKLRNPSSRHDGDIRKMRVSSNIKTAYFVRYADDWVILTDSRESAEKLKHRAKQYLHDTLKLELAEEKTLITNVRTRPAKFLGFEIAMRKQNGRWVNYVRPERERLERKLKELKREIFYLRKVPSTDMNRLLEGITRVNSMIVGLVNYYNTADQISVVLRRPAWAIKYTAYKSLKRFGGKWVRANQVSNQIGYNTGHAAHIPAIKANGMWIGITDLNFAKWESEPLKNQQENPYTPEGREIYSKRMRKRGLLTRTDEVNSSEHAHYLRMSKHPLYNFEYFMNRPYCYSRDKGKCRICAGYVEPKEVRIHHVNPKLPKEEVNKVKNLIVVHEYCHSLIHNVQADTSQLTDQSRKNIAKYRKKLES